MRINKNINKKMDIYVTLLIGLFFMAAMTFIYLDLGKSIEGYIMITLVMIIAQISYYSGKTVALIIAMIVDFIYSTYAFYLSFTKGQVLDVKFTYWMIIIPLTALIVSLLSELTIEMQESIDALKKENEKYIMVDECTEIKNASAFMNEMPIYMNLHKRYNMPITLVLVRLKHSKQLERIVGENFFKEIIKKCSDALGETLRYEDGKYLIHRNTFGYILICDEKGALIVKNRMKEAVKEIKIGQDKLYKDLNIEVQIGSFTQNEKVVDAMSFINLAEKELDYDV